MSQDTAFLINMFIIGFAVMLVLYVVAVRLAWAHQIHQLKIEAHRLRDDYAVRLERARLGEDSGLEPVSNNDVEILDEPIGHAA